MRNRKPFVFFGRALVLLICIAGAASCAMVKKSTLEETELTAGISTLYHADGQRFIVYVPQGVLDNPEGARILAVIHGYSGRKNTSRQVQRLRDDARDWRRTADEMGWVVLVPHFFEEMFNNDYQRLNLFSQPRADERLLELAGKISAKLPGVHSRKMFLWGFCGGGQFTHRFTMLHPDRVERSVAGGAGWYAFPDEELPYPIGLDLSVLPRSVPLDMPAFLQSDMLVAVGKKDVDGSAFRTRYSTGDKSYNLREIQGYGRFHRARNYYEALEAYAAENGLEMNIQFYAEPGLDHGVNHSLYLRVKRFLTEGE